jgi:DNA (cytosine-5)-methyltransferase 1
MNKPSVVSLFTGAGGLDYGFEAAGFQTAVAVENDPQCAKTLNENKRGWPIVCDDIHNLNASDLLRKAQLTVGDVDALIGGPPCQPFSKSGYWATGQTRRLSDPRAATLESFLRVLDETTPRVFLLENVDGLGFRGKEEGLYYITQRLQQINSARGTSYRAFSRVLNAADFGVPQMRRRLFIVGSRDGARFIFPAQTHAERVEENSALKARYINAWDAIGDLEIGPPETDLNVTGKWADLLPSIPEGQNYLWHTARGGGEHLFGWRRRYWSFLLKLAKDLPSWTLQAQPGPATGPFHWSNRRLSRQEMMRLQTFPTNVTITGTYGEAQRQLGNAVPSLLAEVLARAIRSQLLGHPVTGALQLALSAKPTATPPPEKLKPVPARYLSLRGIHEAHPGTGKGYRAASRDPYAGLRTQKLL